jgi:hypothetical protein
VAEPGENLSTGQRRHHPTIHHRLYSANAVLKQGAPVRPEGPGRGAMASVTTACRSGTRPAGSPVSEPCARPRRGRP